MSTSYMSQDSLIQDRQLEVLRLSIPLSIVANATPASKTQSNDEPARLFLNTEGVQQITLANGAVSSVAELSAITFASPSDATGVFNLLLKFNEPVIKVCSAMLVRSNGQEVISCTLTSAPASGITSAGSSVVLNADSAVNFATTNYNACLEIAVQVGLV